MRRLAIVLVSSAVLVVALSSLPYGQKEEEQITFHDADYAGAVVSKLEEHNVPFRENGATIYYDVVYRKKVDEIISSINSNYPAIFKFARKSEADVFSDALTRKGIKHEKFKQGDTYVLQVGREDAAAAKTIFDKKF